MASMVKQLKQSIRANRRELKKSVKSGFDLLAMRPTFLASAMNGGLTYMQARAVERGDVYYHTFAGSVSPVTTQIKANAFSIRRQALLKLPVEIKRAS